MASAFRENHFTAIRQACAPRDPASDVAARWRNVREALRRFVHPLLACDACASGKRILSPIVYSQKVPFKRKGRVRVETLKRWKPMRFPVTAALARRLALVWFVRR